jgi:hypothetical protein
MQMRRRLRRVSRRRFEGCKWLRAVSCEARRTGLSDRALVARQQCRVTATGAWPIYFDVVQYLTGERHLQQCRFHSVDHLLP